MPTERTWVKAPVHLDDIIAVKTGIRATNSTSKGWSSPCILYPRAAPLVSIVTAKRGVKMWEDFSMESLLVSNCELAIQPQSQVQSTSVQPLVISISHPQRFRKLFDCTLLRFKTGVSITIKGCLAILSLNTYFAFLFGHNKR